MAVDETTVKGVTGYVREEDTHKGVVVAERSQELHLGLIEVPKGAHPVYLRVEDGETVNLGNYNSKKFLVGVTLPCVPTDPEMEAAYERAVSWVERKLASRVDPVKAANRSSGGGGRDDYFG